MLKATRTTRQNRQFIAAVVAASGSFIIGVFLPLDFGTKSAKSVVETNPVINEANTKENNRELQQIVTIKQTIASKVQASENSLKLLELKLFNFATPKRFQGKVVKDLKVTGADKYIALTFDDGPWPKTTEMILDILKANEIEATFFVLGKQLKRYPDLAPKIVDEGHVLANHTWNHPTSKMTQERVRNEVDKTAELIYELTGMTTTLFRPPGGVLDNGLADFVKERNHVVVMWSADSLDWKQKSAKKVTENVLKKVSNGGIVLLHDGGGPRMHVVKALPKIIEELKKQGYQFVTVPELLEIKDRELTKKEQLETINN